MHLREAGSGPPLLLLHGWTCHGGFFDDLAARLSADARVIAPDLPGHGLTPRDAHPLTIEGAADACAALLAARGLRDVVVVGWSMGAAVAWSMIARHGTGRLKALVVEEMSPRVLNDATWRLGMRHGLDAAGNAIVLERMRARWEATAAAVIEGVFAEGIAPDPALLAPFVRDVPRADPDAMAALWASLTAQDFRGLLPEIGIPVVVAYGEGSRLYAPEVARWQVERLPFGRLAPFARSGHAPHLEEAEAFAGMVRGVLSC
ncbi:alpha/beta fold hydrolase [Salinarimonas sp.]|uniref:alpha/beta fold hydrolase n=1 Tax=Salinarimonas sp. TaxID=2766526 RepID=UPI0032D94F48